MDLESLVKKIAAEILQELKGELTSELKGGLVRALGSDKKTIAVFGKPDEAYPDPVSRIINSGVRVLYVDDDWQGQNIDRYILPFMTLNQMGDLSRGMARGRIAGMVLDTVLRGRTVEVAEYGVEHYRKTAPEALVSLYETQKETLMGFGIRPLKVDQGGQRKSMCLTEKSLITEKDIHQALARHVNRLKVAKNGCVTPLAADLARENQIEIIRDPGRPSGANKRRAI